MFYFNLVGKIVPALAFRLSQTVLGGFFLYCSFVSFLLVKKIWKDDKPWLFHFFYHGTAFRLSLCEGSPDIAALKEIFIDGEYAWDDIGTPKTIVDLGAHIGNTALYFHVLYPDAVIYAVEASPKNYARLLENVKDIPQIKPIFSAVSDTDGTLTFYESESTLGSSVKKRNEGDCAVFVPCVTLQTLFAQQKLAGVDFMKIDIEGSEECLFTQASPETFSRSYIIEVHEDLMSSSVEEFVHSFRNFNIHLNKTDCQDRMLLRALYK